MTTDEKQRLRLSSLWFCVVFANFYGRFEPVVVAPAQVDQFSLIYLLTASVAGGGKYTRLRLQDIELEMAGSES